jgi:cysteine synthase
MQSSVIDIIGDTPLVALKRLSQFTSGRLVAKLEYVNPGGSKKDRVARQIIEDAENAGLLQPGRTVVELTSGNTGAGLAIVCAVKGYPFVAVMSQGNSPERARMMAAFGAQVVLVPQCSGSVSGQVSGCDLALLEEHTARIVRERDAFRADQFRAESNFRAHYLHTGHEILAQSRVPIDAFCDFVGTGGTFSGCSAAFKEVNPATQCYVVEPKGAAILAGHYVRNPHHRIQGGGYAIDDLPMLRREYVDGFIEVSDVDAIKWSRSLARIEGILAGFSAGANLAAAAQLLENDFQGKSCVVIVPDSGLKYMSTDLWPCL